jgi:alpha-ribazole phosphatase
MKLYLVRHTRVDVPPGVCYGQSDVPLADSFETESASVLSQLSAMQFDRAYSSPLSRCAKLGRLLSPCLQLDDRLKELDFGEWEYREWDAIFHSEAGQKWFADYLNEACPGGESYRDMLRRVAHFIDDLPPTGGDILIVTHAGVIRAFRFLLEKTPTSVDTIFNRPVAYGEISIMERRQEK